MITKKVCIFFGPSPQKVVNGHGKNQMLGDTHGFRFVARGFFHGPVGIFAPYSFDVMP